MVHYMFTLVGAVCNRTYGRTQSVNESRLCGVNHAFLWKRLNRKISSNWKDELAMSADFNIRSREYWRRLGWGLLVGLRSAIRAVVFIALMNLGQAFILPELTDWTPFSGSWLMVGIMTLAGLLVGLLHHFAVFEESDVFDALDKGRLDPKPVPAALLASLISLIGGFSLGPEVPTGMLAAGLGTWISERRKMATDIMRTNVIGGVSAAYGGLFSSPFVMLLVMLESAHVQSFAYYGALLISGLSATIGFGLFYFLGGDSFSSLLGLLSPPVYDLRLWHLGAGMLMGVLAVPIGLLFPILTKILSRLVAPLNGHPICAVFWVGFCWACWRMPCRPPSVWVPRRW